MARVCKVLIVESDRYVRELLGDAFEDEGFLFDTVENGAAMEQALDRDDYDIVVIDLTPAGRPRRRRRSQKSPMRKAAG